MQEVTHESWFSRIGSSIKGVLFGGVIFLLAFPVLFWNEGRAVKTAKGLNEGESTVVTVSSQEISPENEGRLIHTIGRAETTERLEDPQFEVGATGIHLRRVVEMFQWEEDESSTTEKKVGGSTETVTEYTYSKVWSSDLIDSREFADQSYQNPTEMEYTSQTWSASEVHLGAFQLPETLISQIEAYEPLEVPATTGALGNFVADKSEPNRFVLSRNADSEEPQIGDLRMEFLVTKPTDVSLVSQQVGDSFTPYATSVGTELHMLSVGSHTSEAMFAAARQMNTILTWVLRGAGLAMLFFGSVLVLRPISVFADVLPIAGNIAEMGLGLISGVVALSMGLTTIGVAWVFYRPLLGGTLIAVAIGVIVWLVMKRKGTVTSSESVTAELTAAV